MRGTYRLALTLGLIAFGAGSAEATEKNPTDDASSPTVRVINNYVTSVQVYLEDADGKLHRLCRVARSDVKILEIAPELSELGAYQIKIFPDSPVWSPAPDDVGIRTPDLSLAEGEALNFWVEPDLRSSKLEYTNG